jgi:hypothetical protein
MPKLKNKMVLMSNDELTNNPLFKYKNYYRDMNFKMVLQCTEIGSNIVSVEMASSLI